MCFARWANRHTLTHTYHVSSDIHTETASSHADKIQSAGIRITIFRQRTRLKNGQHPAHPHTWPPLTPMLAPLLSLLHPPSIGRRWRFPLGRIRADRDRNRCCTALRLRSVMQLRLRTRERKRNIVTRNALRATPNYACTIRALVPTHGANI